MFPIEFAVLDTPLVQQYTETFISDDDFIKEIAATISALELTETIGITSLHHKALLLKNDTETIEERTDRITRIHYLGRLEKASDNWQETHINTLWTYNLTVNRNCEQACKKLCSKNDYHC
jgi:hypothetical protein